MSIKVRVYDKESEQYYLNLASENCRKGREDGIRIFIEIWNSVSKERLIPLLSEKFKMSEIQAMIYIEKYWETRVIKAKEKSEETEALTEEE